MKRVVDVDMVAHLWAHQTQEDARNAGGNFYFQGEVIFSYGSHFPIARRMKDCVLFTTHNYSSTTAGHKSAARSACQHLTVFTVPDIGVASYGSAVKVNHKTNLENYASEIQELTGKMRKAKSRADEYRSMIDAKVGEANAYAAHFKLKRKFAPLTDADLEAIASASK